jgi:IS605 OrfB family transposase
MVQEVTKIKLNLFNSCFIDYYPFICYDSSMLAPIKVIEKQPKRDRSHCFSQTVKTHQNHLSKGDSAMLDDIILLFNKEKRHWFNYSDQTSTGRKTFIQHQRQFYGNVGYSYRFFQGIRQEVQGMQASMVSNEKNYLIDKKSALRSQEKKINNASISYKARKAKDTLKPNELFNLTQHYKKKYHLENSIIALEKSAQSVCFGGKKLLKERSRLHNKADIKAWSLRWHHARNNQAVFVGSHEETQGNQNCQLTFDVIKNTFALKLRIPDCLIKKGQSKYLIMTDFKVPHYAYEKVKNEVLKQQTKDKSKESLSFRLIKKDKGYAVNITLNVEKKTVITSSLNGLIGVDINPDNLAVTEIDAKGNFINSFVLEVDLKRKSQCQRQDIINNALIALKDHALKTGKDIVLEQLDFKKKRSELHKNKNAKYARMLSAFAYQQIISGIVVLGYKFGVHIKHVDPSYTSVIGKNKYAIPLGLSVHQAAAFVIARRGYAYKEKIKQLFQTNKKSVVFTLLVPEGKQHFDEVKSSAAFVRWLRGKFGKNFCITEQTTGAELYTPHNKLNTLLCDSDRILSA